MDTLFCWYFGVVIVVALVFVIACGVVLKRW